MHKEYLIDFEKYIISEDGTIFSKCYNKNRNLEGQVNRDGYVVVHLCCTDGKYRKFCLHRVIYFYFNGEIPENLQVNHLDECKLNNALSNLNLLTPKENCNWGTRNERLNLSQRNVLEKSKPLAQINLETGEVLATFPSASEAARQLGFGQSTISRCCNGGYYNKSRGKWVNFTQVYGFGWRYV